MWWETVPYSWAGVIETTFAKLCSCCLLNVFSQCQWTSGETDETV